MKNIGGCICIQIDFYTSRHGATTIRRQQNIILHCDKISWNTKTQINWSIEDLSGPDQNTGADFFVVFKIVKKKLKRIVQRKILFHKAGGCIYDLLVWFSATSNV